MHMYARIQRASSRCGCPSYTHATVSKLASCKNTMKRNRKFTLYPLHTAVKVVEAKKLTVQLRTKTCTCEKN